jgi:hypothetical protein
MMNQCAAALFDSHQNLALAAKTLLQLADPFDQRFRLLLDDRVFDFARLGCWPQRDSCF